MIDYKIIIKHKFVKFIFVGIINSIFGYGCFAVFLYIGFHYSMSLLFSTIIGVIFNFKSTGTFVFGSHDNQLIFRFSGSYIVIYFLNIFGVFLLLNLGIPPYIGGAILIIPMAVLAFILNKRFVFNYV